MQPLFNIFGNPIFQGVSFWDLVVLVIVYTGAFMVKGVFGIGAMPVIVLIGVWVLESHHAVLLGMLVVTYSNLMFIPEALRRGDWQICGRLAIGYIPTVLLGVWIFEHLSHAWMGAVIGFVLIGIIITDAVISPSKMRKLAIRLPKSGSVLMASLSGVINGLIGTGSLIFISLYIKPLYDDARRFRATLILLSILLSFWRFAVQYVKGIITVSLVYESLVLVPATFLGTYLGIRLFKSMLSDRYFKAFRIFLILAALAVVFRSLVAIY